MKESSQLWRSTSTRGRCAPGNTAGRLYLRNGVAKNNPEYEYLDASGELKGKYRQYVDPRHDAGWRSLSTFEKYRRLLGHLDRCCGRAWQALEEGVDVNDE